MGSNALKVKTKYRLRTKLCLWLASKLSRVLEHVVGAAGIPVCVTITVDEAKVDAGKCIRLEMKGDRR